MVRSCLTPLPCAPAGASDTAAAFFIIDMESVLAAAMPPTVRPVRRKNVRRSTLALKTGASMPRESASSCRLTSFMVKPPELEKYSRATVQGCRLWLAPYARRVVHRTRPVPQSLSVW